MMRSNTFTATSLFATPMQAISLAIPDLGRNLDPQILITLDPEGPWNLKVPKGKVDFSVSGSTDGYYVKNATLTALSSNNGSAISLAFTAYFEDIVPIGA